MQLTTVVFVVFSSYVYLSVCLSVCKGRKGEKGSSTRSPVIVTTESNGLPTGFIEGPPGPPGQPGIPGKKVRNYFTIVVRNDRCYVDQ